MSKLSSLISEDNEIYVFEISRDDGMMLIFTSHTQHYKMSQIAMVMHLKI